MFYNRDIALLYGMISYGAILTGEDLSLYYWPSTHSVGGSIVLLAGVWASVVVVFRRL